MLFLSRIPVWCWYLFSVAYCYVLWNPYYSMFQMLQGDYDPALKTVLFLFALIVGSLYIVEGHRTLNIWGITLFVGLFAAIFWLASRMGIHHGNSVQWWGQWVVGFLLTLALQGGRIYRSLTGRVPVGTTITDDVHHHG